MCLNFVLYMKHFIIILLFLLSEIFPLSRISCYSKFPIYSSNSTYIFAGPPQVHCDKVKCVLIIVLNVFNNFISFVTN